MDVEEAKESRRFAHITCEKDDYEYIYQAAHNNALFTAYPIHN
jgi:hypothetical protein